MRRGADTRVCSADTLVGVLALVGYASACPGEHCSPLEFGHSCRQVIVPSWLFRGAANPVRMNVRPMKGDENLAEVQLPCSFFDARTGGRVADRVNRKSEAFDRAAGFQPASSAHDEFLRLRGVTSKYSQGLALKIPRRGVEVSCTPLCGLATLRDPSSSSSFTICVIPSFDLIGSPRKLNGVRCPRQRLSSSG